MAETKSRDEAVREIAYKIWQDEGQPEGRDESHWEQAQEIYALKSGAKLPTMPPGDGETVEPAIALENQAVMPGLTDQAESNHVPKRRKAPTKK